MIRLGRSFYASSLASLLAIAVVSAEARAQAGVIGWGGKVFDSRGATDSFAMVEAGSDFTLALRADGSLVAWGSNEDARSEVPAQPGGLVFTSMSADYEHALALRSDGSVVA